MFNNGKSCISLLKPVVLLIMLLTTYRVIIDKFLNIVIRGETYSFLCSLNKSREGPKLILRLAFSVALCMPLIYLWYLSDVSRFTIGLGYSVTLNTTASENLTKVNDGLRMVVFGGGDVATPNLSASERDGQGYGWTEIMCQKLGCDTHLSFVPKAEGSGGALLSKPLLEAAYRHVSAPVVNSNRHDNTVDLDYSWVEAQYPKPQTPDLAAQIDSFLSSSRTQRGASETLWIFNVGYWDIWYLAALPRRLATQVIDSSVRDLFFQIERLYQAAQDRESAAFSEPYSTTSVSASIGSGYEADKVARAPFRIFLTRAFDISLTPGFATTRPKPPHPHSSGSQLRNAAFLTNYWNALLEAAVDDWLARPDPEYWTTTDTVDTQVVKALVGGRPLPIDTPYQKHYRDLDNSEYDGTITLPRREFASYGISRYLQEMMVDHQLRNSDLFDHKGLGTRPSEYGFLDITMPCTFEKSGDGVMKKREEMDAESKTVVCEEPDNYLFYTGFTVGQRAIREIGIRAARRLLDQVEDSSKWREKAIMRKDSGRQGKGRKT